MMLCTLRPVVLNVYQASQCAEPVVASARTSRNSIFVSLPRSTSIFHIAPACAPFRSVNTGSENCTSGA